METWLGGDSKITMDLSNVYTETDNYEQTTMLRDGIPSLRKWWGNTMPTSSSSWLLNVMLPSHHHITRIIDVFHYFLITVILYSVQ